MKLTEEKIFLEKHLEKISEAVSETVGYSVKFQIEEKISPMRTYFGLVVVDKPNLREFCGITACLYESVNIRGNVVFTDEDAYIQIYFAFNTFDSEYSKSEICRIFITAKEFVVL